MSDEITVRPLAVVVGGRIEPTDDHWGDVVAEIRLADWVPSGVFEGLDGFSHLEVIYVFDLVVDVGEFPARRRPRGRDELDELGALAQRHKDRWNRLGLSRATLLEVGERALRVQGLDAVAGTPIIDLKPWFKEFGPRGAVREPGWVSTLTQPYF